MSYHGASPNTRISLATAGLFISEDEMPQSGDEQEGKPPQGLGSGLMKMHMNLNDTSPAVVSVDLYAQPLLPPLPPTAREPYFTHPLKPGAQGPGGWGSASDPRHAPRHVARQRLTGSFCLFHAKATIVCLACLRDRLTIRLSVRRCGDILCGYRDRLTMYACLSVRRVSDGRTSNRARLTQCSA
jgi:hypothetical protein